MDKKGFSNAVIWIAVGILALLAAKEFGYIGTTTAPQVNVQTTPQTSTGVIKACTNPSVTMTLGPQKAWNQPSNSMSTINIKTWINGVDQGLLNDSATKTVSADDQIKLIYGFNGQVSGAAAQYYADEAEFKAPCQTFSSADYSNGANVLVQNGTITWNNRNSDTGNNPAANDNETIANGEDGRFKIVITTGQYTGISPIRVGADGKNSKMILLVELNSTAYDMTKITLDGKSPDILSKPSSYTLTGTDFDVRGFSQAGCPDVSGTTTACSTPEMTLKVTKKSAANMGDVGIIGQKVKTCIYDQNWNTNTVTNAPLFAYENDVGTRIGFSTLGQTLTAAAGAKGNCFVFNVQSS